MIGLFLDQGLPRDAAKLLRGLGYTCAHAGEIGLSAASDAEILEWAVANNAMIVTLDADFHMILAVSSAAAPSVIRLRVEGLKAAAVAEIVQGAINQFQSELTQGSLITVKANKTTCHKLPIGASRA